MHKSRQALQAFELFAISFLSLFLEIALIRWIPGNVKLMGYYTNTVLISSFLGLGVGCLLVQKKLNLIDFFAPLTTLLILVCYFSPSLITRPFFFIGMSFSILLLTLLVTVRKNRVKGALLFLGLFLLAGLGMTVVKQFSLQESRFFHQWFEKGYVLWGGKGTKATWLLLVPFLFLMNAAVFLSIGQVVGRKIALFKPLTAYAINLFGSLVGVLAMTLLSFFNSSPVLWFGLVFAGISIFFFHDRRVLLLSWAFFCISLFITGHPQSAAVEFWSPYYKIELEKLPEGRAPFGVTVNHDFYQVAVNLSKEAVRRDPNLLPSQLIYDLPYQFNRPKTALILGSGTGNDVAAALRNGIQQVTAVEIDPIILNFGKRYHPENPYQDSRVIPHTTDARAFLKNDRALYDVISFGTLDSHSLFSALGNIRLDSYVYTLESFREARRRLSENGLLTVTFNVARPWIATKIYQMMEHVFGHPPLVLHPENRNHQTFIIGEKEVRIPSHLKKKLVQEDLSREGGVTLPTDDWPHLYIRTKSISNEYITVILLLSFFSILLTRYLVGRSHTFHPVFSFLGAAFLLLETKSITYLSLLFGSTWLVNCAVISSILLTVLLANFLVILFKPKRLSALFLCLFAALLLNYIIPPQFLLVSNPVLRTVLTCFFTSLPILFAGMIFAALFSLTKDPATALGSNLIGSVIGGLVEYSSLLFGSRAMYLLAFLFYFIALMSTQKSRAQG